MAKTVVKEDQLQPIAEDVNNNSDGSSNVSGGSVNDEMR